jgi:AraC-like DNA-binding protein
MNPAPPPATPPHVVRFSTDDLPERDRIAYTREVYGRRICGLEVEPDAGVPFHFSQSLTILPELCFSKIDCSPHKIYRTRSLLADGNDDLFLYWCESAPFVTNNCGHEAHVIPGSGVSSSAADTGVNHFAETKNFTSVTLRRRLVKAVAPSIEDLLARPISGETPALRLLKGYLNLWQNGELAATAQEQQALSNHVYDLIALIYGAKGDAAEQAAQGGGRAAQLAMIQREIAHSFADPDFSLLELARRTNTHPRHVQRLLEQANSSFVREMIEHRLTLARDMLRSPRHRHQTVTEISYACGFGNISHFNRQFRLHFGATPTEVRMGGGLGAKG